MRNLNVFFFLLPILSCGLEREQVYLPRACFLRNIDSIPPCIEYIRRTVPAAKDKCQVNSTYYHCNTKQPTRTKRAFGFRPLLEFQNAQETYEDIVGFIKIISRIKNPDTGKPLAQAEIIGKTSEDRDIYLIKVSTDHSAKKPIIFFEAGMHAREWAAPTAALYMIYQLVKNYRDNRKLLKKIDFYIIPLSNPDGYEYSRTEDRYWRKTRSRQGKEFGVDGNRNFDVHWAEVLEKTNEDPASELYKGPWPFSEPETRSIRDAGIKYKDRIKAFVSIHAYGALIGYGWGYSTDIRAPLERQMRMVAMEAAKAIKQYSGRVYKIGASSKLLYPSAGGSDDYFKEILGVDLSYTFELSSLGTFDFNFSKEQVIKISREAFEGFKKIAEYAASFDTERACFKFFKAPFKDLIC